MDLHELPASSSRASYRENFLETIGASGGVPVALSGHTTAISRHISRWMSHYGYGLNVFYDHPGDSLRLCHRYLGLYQGFPAFLCESKQGPDRPLAYRAGFHILAGLVVANYLTRSPLVPTPVTSTPVQVAQQAVQPPVQSSLPVPLPTSITMRAEPTADEEGNELIQIMTQVTGGAEFAFVTLEVGGVAKALSNQRRCRYVLKMGDLKPGDCPITARAYNSSDQVLASQQLTLTVPSPAEGLAR